MKSGTLNKYVTFKLGDTRFAVSVLKTREIVEYGKITPVPEAPEFIEGVINLRGSVVPVVNLTTKFFQYESTITEHTSIMIVEPEIDDELTKMGLIVDIVSDVLEIKEKDLEPPPKYGSKLKSAYLLGVTTQADDFIMILDIDRILSRIELVKDLAKNMQLNKEMKRESV